MSDGSNFGDVAFEPDGTFYVADVGNHRIQKFDPQRRFISAWGSFGGADGQFVSANSVATDGAGHVYVGDDLRRDVQAFTSDGTFLGEFAKGSSTSLGLWHVEVDPVSKDVLVTRDLDVARYSPDGELLATIDPPFDQPVTIAFDAAGDLYIGGDKGPVNGGDPDSVVILDPSGKLKRRITVAGSQIAVTPDGTTLLVDYYDWDKVQAYGLAPAGGN